MREFRFLMSIFLATIAFGSFGYAGSGYHQEGSDAAYKVQDILISYKICENHNECSKKEIVFFAPTWDGFYVYTYGITNMNILQKIIQELKLQHKQYNRKIFIGFAAYQETHQTVLSRGLIKNLWNKFFGKPLIHIEYKKDIK